jgi:Tol biopolymer transport system component
MTSIVRLAERAVRRDLFRSLLFSVFIASISSPAAAQPPPLDDPTAPWTHYTTTVNRRADGTHGSNVSQPRSREALSRDGRYALFASAASDLVPNDTNNAQDVFVKDRLTGEIQRVSVSGSIQANGPSWPGAITPDGKWIVFQSSATNLVANDTNGADDLFVHNRITRVTVRVSLTANRGPTNGHSLMPTISANGRFIAFVTMATNMGPTTSPWQLFVHDRDADGDNYFDEPAAISITWLSRGTNTLLNGVNENPSISADGRYVAFESDATDLVAGDTNNARDIFVIDRQTNLTRRVNVSPYMGPAPPNTRSTWPAISADGRIVVFDTDARLASEDPNSIRDVYAHDLTTGQTTLISRPFRDMLPSSQPSVSEEGRFVLFHSPISNFVGPWDWPNGGWYDPNAIRLFVFDRFAMTTMLASVSSSGRPTPFNAVDGSISGDGSTVSFSSRYLDPDSPQWENISANAYVSVPFSVTPLGEPPLVIDVPVEGGEGTLTVATTNATGWRVTSGASWLTATPSPASGSQTVTWQAQPSEGPARETTLRIGHVPFTFRQAERLMVTSISPIGGSAGGGEAVTIKGYGFRGSVQVLFGDAPGISPTIVDVETLNVITPAGTAGAYAPIRVIVDGQVAHGTLSYYYQPPDSTPPVIVGTASGPRSGGWYTGEVRISWSVTDPESLVTSTSGCDTQSFYQDTAGTSFTCTAASGGGTNAQTIVVKHDHTVPSARVRHPSGVYEAGTIVTADYTCMDALSGVAICNGQVGSGTSFTISGTPGMKTFQLWTVDYAGNSVVWQSPYAIATGVCIPQEMLPLVNWWSADGVAADMITAQMPLPESQPTYAPGRTGQAFMFDGSSIIEVPNANAGQLTGERTLAMWVKPADVSEPQVLIAGDGGGFMFGLSASHTLRLQSRQPTPAAYNIYHTVHPDEWTHLVVTLVPQSPTLTRVTVYRNGAFIHQSSFPAFVNGTSFLIGGLRGAERYHGSIDELQIFSAALSEQAVMDLYLAGGSGLCRMRPQIAWAPPSMMYGASTLSGAHFNATANVPGSFTFDQSIGTTLPVGTHTLTGTFTSTDSRYAPISVSTTVVVYPAPVVIKADDVRMVYRRGPMPALTASAIGLVNNETISSLSGSLALTTSGTTDSPAGAYAITPSGVSSPDYAITFEPGTLTIDKAETIARVTVSAEPSIAGSTVAFRVAVSRTEFQYPGVPDGAVTLSEGGVTLAQGTLAADGVATIPLSSLPAGAHAIDVSYAGSTNFQSLTRVVTHEVLTEAPEPTPSLDWDGFTTTVHRRADGTKVAASSSSQWFQKTVSRDGRYVVFSSAAPDVVPGDGNGVSDLFVKDRQTNAVVRVSAGPGGVDAAGTHSHATISADGQHIAFASTASTLVADDTNGYTDVFVYDVARQTTVLVSRRLDGGPTNGNSHWAAISADGRFVAFLSSATNMLPNGAAGQIFLHDRDADADGLYDEADAVSTIWVSGPGSVPAVNGACEQPSISDDGRYVTYESKAYDLVLGDSYDSADLFIYDRLTRDTIRIPLPSSSNDIWMTPRLSGNGRYVAFSSARALTASDTNGTSDVYLFDQATGKFIPISVGAPTVINGWAVYDTDYPSLSDDGRYVTYQAHLNLVGFANRMSAVVVYDRQTGVTRWVTTQGFKGTLSGDGSTIVYESLTPMGGDSQTQVYAAVHLSVAAAPAHFGPDGGDGTLTVTTTPVTDWGIAQFSAPAWITFSPANRIGSGVLSYHVDAIPLAEPFRAAPIKIAAASALVQQRGFPRITNVTPAHGPAEGGTVVRIYGEGFAAPIAVTFGETPAASIQLLSQVEMHVTTPPGVSGANVAVRVVADGHEATGASFSFHYDDATPPVVTGAATGPVSANGEWLTGQAQIAWTIVDPESAIVSTSGCEAVTITEDTAGRTFTCSATSEGGTSSASVTVKRDGTPPTARVQAPAGIYEPGASATVDYACDDALSGVGRCEGPIASGAPQTMDGAAGTYDFEVIAEDRAGHQVTVLAPYAIATGVCIAPATQPLASWWTADQTALEGIEGVGGIEPVTVTYAPGRVGQAFQFAGSAGGPGSSGSSVLNFPGYRGDLTGNRSLALWINPSTSTSEQPRVFVSRAASYAFALFPDRTLGYQLSDSAAWTRTAVRVEADRWTHLAMVLTVTSGDTQVQVYRDGRLEDTQTIAGSVVTGGGALTFGGAVPTGGTEPAPSFAGLLDEVQIFSASLDAAAVRALALAGSKGLCRPVAIAWSAAPLVYGTPLGAAQLTPTANVPGTFEFTPAAGAVLAAGEHMLNVTFTPADGATHGSASAKTVVQVTPAPLTIRAVDVMQPFGAPIPAFAAAGEGFVNGDTLASLGGALSFATTATPTSPVGTYPIVPSGLTSTSYAIAWAPGTLTIQQAATTTTLAASSLPSGLNEPVTFTANVLAVAPGAGVPTGTIAFSNGATLLGRVALVNGAASLTTGGLGSGTKTITAQYEGDTSFLTSTATLSHIVATSSQSTSTTLTASPNPASVGQTITLSASVSRSAGAVTGMVRFFDGDTLLGESAIAIGVARLTINTLAAGTHGISAMYVGAPNVPASRSAVVAVRVGSGGSRTPSLSWTVTPSTGALGAESTFTLQIARSLGTSPTGWVQFSIDGLPPNPAHRITVQTNGTSASTATLRLSTLPRGTHKITALYSGDGTFRPGASVVTHVIQ